MNTRVLRFAPIRDLVQRANTWRIWVQGNECYLAMRDGTRLFKVSLHRHFRWQLSGSTMVHRLARPISRSDGWVLALQLAFLIDDDVLRPVTKTDASYLILDVPVGCKYLVNVLFPPGAGKNAEPIPKDFGGNVLGRLPLRNGRSVLVTGFARKRSSQDMAIVKDVRDNLRVTLTAAPIAGNFYAEALVLETSSSTGNVIAIVPLGLDSTVVTARLPVSEPPT
jgi:hypothetical protein